MTSSFDPIEYLEYLRRRWKLIVLAVILAGSVALVSCLLLTKQYTAVATLDIEPPGSDLRSATAVSAIYLESLKSYEALASNNTLFAKACEKFRLLDGKASASLEAFKRRVLRVDKLKDTKVLEISITLPDANQAQAVVQYLADESVALDRGIASVGDREILDRSRQQLEAAQKDLDQARAEATAARVSAPVLDNEVRSLEDRKARAEAQRVEANMLLAESSARLDQESTAANKAGVAAITADITAMQRDLDTKSATLAALQSRIRSADERLRGAEDTFDRAAKHADEASASAMFRTGQLRVLDPGVVPQRPSFPNPLIAVLSAVAIAAMFCLVWFTLQFGLMRQREQPARTALRVAGGGGR